MKLDPQILKQARSEADQHLISDLQFTSELHRFMDSMIDVKTYLSSEFGFKKFLYDYGVGRTLQGGDEVKLKILKLIQKFRFEKNHVNNITFLSNILKDKKLSSLSSSGRHGLPQSFCSKLLYIYKPHEIIPYDSYVLKSLQNRAGQSIKTLDAYYTEANRFRQTHFPETGKEVRNKLEHIDDNILSSLAELQIDPVKLMSWKLTDKYLWCEEWIRRTNQQSEIILKQE